MTCPSHRRGIGLLILLLAAGCQPRQGMTGGQRSALVVNELEMSAEELRQEFSLAEQTPSRGSVRLEGASETEPEWLARVIERELLVQEAQRLGLDRDPAFMRTIERFWKEALLKQLLSRQGREIASQVQVYDPEVEQRYAEMTREDPSLGALGGRREEIQRMIRLQKQQDAMERWIGELKAKAKIRIDQEAIARLQ